MNLEASRTVKSRESRSRTVLAFGYDELFDEVGPHEKTIRRPSTRMCQTPIESVSVPLNSRDELPPVLAGLQWVFKTPEINEQILALLERQIVGDKQETGRPGMDLWHILVLGHTFPMVLML
ncbi:MAG: hypothetical protein ACI9DF_004384 [Verrucomicrobiales bacterium]